MWRMSCHQHRSDAWFSLSYKAFKSHHANNVYSNVSSAHSEILVKWKKPFPRKWSFFSIVLCHTIDVFRCMCVESFRVREIVSKVFCETLPRFESIKIRTVTREKSRQAKKREREKYLNSKKVSLTSLDSFSSRSNQETLAEVLQLFKWSWSILSIYGSYRWSLDKYQVSNASVFLYSKSLHLPWKHVH